MCIALKGIVATEYFHRKECENWDKEGLKELVEDEINIGNDIGTK